MIQLYTSEDYIGHFEQKAGEALLQRYKLYQTQKVQLDASRCNKFVELLKLNQK